VIDVMSVLSVTMPGTQKSPGGTVMQRPGPLPRQENRPSDALGKEA